MSTQPTTLSTLSKIVHVFYPADSITHPLNKQGLYYFSLLLHTNVSTSLLSRAPLAGSTAILEINFSSTSCAQLSLMVLIYFLS